jgi:sulfur-oxidizing protein SoxB
MISRRETLQIGAAAAAAFGAGPANFTRAMAQQRLSESDLLRADNYGNVTLLHFADLHAQLVPVFYREPSQNLGAGDSYGLPPHVTGEAFLKSYGIAPDSAAAYAMSAENFSALARAYGRIGGLDRMATAVKAIRATRGEDRVLLLDGGDTLQGSLGANRTKGQDVIDCVKLLRPDAMTGHWEFTYGEDRFKDIISHLGYPFLALNIRDSEWQEPVFPAYRIFDKVGVKIAVLGEAFAYTPIANPGWMIPKWTFGIREEDVRTNVGKARRDGAQLVVLLSHNGFDCDRKMASRVPGIDVILTAHTHDALPEVTTVGKTLLIASGSAGKFLSRLDLDVRGMEVAGFRYKLIPLFSDAIHPDAEMAAAVAKARAPFADELRQVAGRTDTLLYRRGTLNGTFDDLICNAILSERDAEIAVSPGFRWGTSVLPDTDITVEDIHNATAITYPQVYRMTMNGARLKEILEAVADNLFNPDPYYQQGGDMVRCGGIGYRIDIGKPIGQRISDITLLKSGKPVDAAADYVVAGWGSVTQGGEGPPAWDVLQRHVSAVKNVHIAPNTSIKLVGH